MIFMKGASLSRDYKNWERKFLSKMRPSYITDDTYIVVATVSFGIIKERPRAEEKTITFSRSPKPGERRDEEEERYREAVSQRGLRETFSTRLAVYAGGRITPQSAIVREVRQRLIRVVKDII